VPFGTHPQIKIDVFERLNTGAVQLNPQEVRNGIYHGKLIECINDLAKEKIWKKISGIKSNNRMKGSELILRYFALLYDQGSYKKPLKKFLNEFCEKNRDFSESKQLEWKRQFLSAIEIVDILFEKHAFRVLNENLEPVVKNFNAAIFDSVMIGVTRSGMNREQAEAINKNKFKRDFLALTKQEKFTETISVGTSATAAVNYRINEFQKYIDSYLN
jgi:hypothetical protein